MTAFLVRLRGGPMAGWLVWSTAPVLRPDWQPGGRYVLHDPPVYEYDARVARWVT